MATGKRRLVKLYNYIDAMPDDRWYFSEWCASNDSICGTVGCGLGQCVNIWPRDFKIVTPVDGDLDLSVRINGTWCGGIMAKAEEFFRLSYDEARDLFTCRGYYNTPTKKEFLVKLERYLRRDYGDVHISTD